MDAPAPGLSVAVVLWRRRWWGLVAAAVVLGFGLTWAFSQGSRWEVLVRVPAIDGGPVATTDAIKSELERVVAPAVLGVSGRVAALGVTAESRFVVMTLPNRRDRAGEIDNAADEALALERIATQLSSWLDERLQSSLDRIDVELEIATDQLEAMRNREGDVIETGESTLGIAKLAGVRETVEEGGIVGPIRERPPADAASRVVAVVVLAIVLGVLAACGVEVIAQARSASRTD